MTLKLLGGSFLFQIYNIEPLFALAIKTTKVSTVHCYVTFHSRIKINVFIYFVRNQSVLMHSSQSS